MQNRPFAEALRGVTPAPIPAAHKPPAVSPSPGASPTKRGATPHAGTPTARALPSAAPSGSPSYSYEDRAAYHQALAGVQPLASRSGGRARSTAERPSAIVDPREESARRRLDQLVAGDLHFDVVRDEEDELRGQRRGGHPSHLRSLDASAVPHGTLDLHGLAGSEAERSVARFVRERHARGDRILLLVHGKGRHSEGSVGVLVEHVLRALTRGGAAPLVLAFRTAPRRFGGSGALLVRLAERG